MSSRLHMLAALALACSPLAAEERPWPFARPDDVAPPEVKDASWVRNPIDAFILQRLEARGWRPAPEAGKRTLIRRLHFDLLGLPPTPEEVERFANDSDPSAYEKLVDRLLKDKRYGERWARRWLDLARYADTAGFEGDPDLPHAWRYRDYVIDAFNNDKPYDLFIKEQLAGDEFQEILGAGDLPATPPERIVAMTFLRLAPFTEPRGDESRHELLSEITGTVGAVFLGLTVGCAKCHDHKHDDIPTKDFYRLKAFFATVSIPRPEPGDGFQIGGPLDADFYRPGEKQWAAQRRTELERELAESKQQLQQLTAELRQRIGGRAGFGLQAMGGPLGNDYFFEQRSVNDGQPHWSLANCDGKQWQFFTDGGGPGKTGSLAGENRGHWFGDLPAARHVSLGQYSSGTGKIATGGAHHVGKFAEILIYNHPLSEEERKQLGEYVTRKRTGAAAEKPPRDGLRFWLDAADLDGDPKTDNPPPGSAVAAWTDRVAGVRLTQTEAERQPQLSTLGKTAAVAFNDDFLVGPLGEAGLLQDQRGAIVVVHSTRHSHEGYGLEVGGEGSFLSTFVNPTAGAKVNLQAAIDDPHDDRITAEQRNRYRHLSTRGRFIPQHLKRLRPVAMSLRHSYGPPYEPGVPTSRVLIRGEHDQPGEVVEAGFLSCITGHQRPAAIRLDPFKRWPTRSRRMALAQWIADGDNPLTARVMVNRLWHWHFGQGIVATPSDFGALGGDPSHPRLLDWLARKFVMEKWSVKAMHRLMVTSSAYRQSSQRRDDAAEKADADNRLLWRFGRRRLEAEAIRDSVLAVSGRLNLEQHGLPIFPPLPDDIAERVKYSSSKWDTQHGPAGRKRSIYIYQQRTLTMPMLQAFDSLVCEQSRPRRRASTTPLQALAMYNGPLVNAEAPHFARRVRERAGDEPAKQVRLAFQLALGRPPGDSEAAKLVEFLTAGDAPEPLVGLCRILYNSNEFIYVD